MCLPATLNVSMTITLNGQPVELPEAEGYTLARLIQDRGLRADRVAVERNGEIAARATWDHTTISPDDRLEVVHFVGGGSAIWT